MLTRLFLFSLLFISLSCSATSPEEKGQAAESLSLSRTDSLPFAVAEKFSDLEPLFHLRNDTTNVINFWATWCPPCRQEMPSLQRLWRTLQPDGVELVAIDFGDPPAPVQEFAREANIRFPLLLDPLGETVRAYGVVGLPTTFVVDRQGQVAIKATGERDWDAQRIVDAIRKLAQE